MLYDGLREEFELAVGIAEEVLLGQTPSPTTHETTKGNTDPTLQSLRNLGKNLASCICLVAERCRDSRTQRRGIEILQRINMRGTFNTAYLVAFCRHLVDLEETRARALNSSAPDELRCEDVPLDARFVQTCMWFCDTEQSEDKFYRKRSGLMKFVERGSHDGDFQIGESYFQVCRDGQV